MYFETSITYIHLLASNLLLCLLVTVIQWNSMKLTLGKYIVLPYVAQDTK